MSSSTPSIDIHGYALDAALGPHWQRGMALAAQGDIAGAVTSFQAIIDVQPGCLPAVLQQAHFLLRADRYRDAIAHARLLARSTPATLEFAWHVIRLLRRFELHEDVARVIDSCNWQRSGDARGLVQLATELGPIGLYGRMTALLERAEHLGLVDRSMGILRGTMAFVAGDAEASQRHLRSVLEMPGPAPAHVRWMLTLQPEPGLIDEDVIAVEAELARAVSGSENEAYLAFALHNLRHARGDTGQAWIALRRGCRAKRAEQPYDEIRQQRIFDALAGLDLPDTGIEEPRAGDPRPVFIVGMFRSGTTVVERVLGGHPEVMDGGESYVMPAAMCEATDHSCSEIIDEQMIQRVDAAGLQIAAERFRAHARWRADGRALFTEKLPANFLHLGFILSSMPEARVIHMRRDPMDTCFSNLRTFFTRTAEYSYDQETLGRYYLGYRQLMACWQRRFPGRILDVDYQAFVDDPEPQARRLLGFCGLEFQPGVLDVGRPGGYSATASIGSVRQGILRDRGGAWRPYEAHLQPLLKALGVEQGVGPD